MGRIEEISDTFISSIESAYSKQADNLHRISKLIFDVIADGGVIQLFGIGHGEEFVNELNFRAGGLAPFHGMRLSDLVTRGLIDQTEIDNGRINERTDILDLFTKIYKLDERDAYFLISFKGNEPLIIHLAKQLKNRGHLVIGVVNRKTYDRYANNEGLLQYCDQYIDLSLDEPDIVTQVNGYQITGITSTVADIFAQDINANLYNLYLENHIDPPILLSANLKDADKHNNALTDVYNGRVR